MLAKPVLLIFLGLMLSACASAAVSVMPSPEFSETVSPSPTTPAPTVTSLPSATPLPSVTPTQTATSTSPSSGQICDGSAFISDVTIRDGTELAPGLTFTKTWKLQNTGSCAWKNDYRLIFLSGDDMNGLDTEINQYVKPGHTANISVALTAPDDIGTYTGYWILANKNGTPFGMRIYVQIVVSGDASTLTPTATHTSTPPSPTSTFTATASSVPASATPTPTDTPTATP